MAKGKPRWKDLTFEERLVKRVDMLYTRVVFSKIDIMYS